MPGYHGVVCCVVLMGLFVDFQWSVNRMCALEAQHGTVVGVSCVLVLLPDEHFRL